MNILDYIIVPVETVINLFLFFIILHHNFRSRVRRNIAFVILFFSFWVLFAFISEIVDSYSWKLYFSRLTYAAVVLGSVFFLNFVYAFNREKLNNIIKYCIHFFIFACAFFTTFTDGIVASITITEASFDLVFGDTYWPFYVVILIYIFSIFKLARQYRKAEGQRKNQLKYLFGGLLFFIGTSIFINVVLRSIIGNDSLYRFGNYSIIVFSIATAYAVVKYRLMDIRLVITRSIVYVLLVTLVMGSFASATLRSNSSSTRISWC